MAGDWIKVETTTPDKPEVFVIAEALGTEPDAVLGKLIRLWVWADQQTYDGNAATVTRALLDRVAGAAGFAEAMILAGWLTDTPGGLVFPNFDRHNGQSAKSRGLTAKRVAAHKAKKGNAPIVTTALPREEKRRVKEDPLNPPRGKSGFDPLTVDLPSELRGPRFQAAWSEWVAHRREIQKKLTATSVRRQLKMLAGLGLNQAIATIDHTIEKGWTGLVAPDKPAAAGAAPANPPPPYVN